jgi:carboxyl-terminal processing protease
VTLENQAAKKERKLVTRNGREHRVGVIYVPGFYQDVQAQSQGEDDFRSTTRDVRRLIEEFEKEGGIDGLVIDLRGDGGGYLPEATALTGLFIDRGPVVQLKDYTGRVEVLEDPNPGVVYDGPLVVLVDRASASASEIFAGAIQDYRRGLVVGQRTFGKGTVQNLVPLDRWSQRPVDGQLTVTIGKFYRVTGESTQHRGVEPDITLPSLISLEDVGESALEAALPWDRIAGVPFQPLRQPASMPTIAMLQRDEDARSQKDPDYRWLVEQVSAFENERKQKTLSLNLEKRKAERERLDAERLARENQRLAQHGQPPLKSNEELEANAEQRPDIILDQTAQILADILEAAKASGPQPAVARENRQTASAQ